MNRIIALNAFLLIPEPCYTSHPIIEFFNKKILTMKIYHLFLVFLLLELCSCSDSNGFSTSEKIIIVDSEKVMLIEPNSAKEIPYFRVRYKDEYDINYWFHISRIKNFDYEEGFIYELKIIEKELHNPIQDQEKISYELIEQISKTKI